ncbi:hypothetical protein [Deinococcus sp.]|uniref:hypothetical protein n=1 Tax=Deinococcus sp. TaxID=47478 RepID=UPI003C7A36FA
MKLNKTAFRRKTLSRKTVHIVTYLIAIGCTLTTLATAFNSSDEEIIPSGIRPLVITKGGVYSGSWGSSDANIPAIDIQTDQPVVIENSTMRGRGNIISALRGRLVIRNSVIYGINSNVSGRPQGNFLNLNEMYSLDVRNNTINGTLGIYMRAYVGSPSKGETIKISQNKFRNIDGRPSNGKGGYQLDYSNQHPHMIQLNDVHSVPNVEISWNEVINEPGKSLVEENINLYESGGTLSSPILIHDNYIQGAYGPQPANDINYAGGGIVLGDSGRDNPTTGFVNVYNNTVVSTTNQGIAIAGGSHNHVFRNRIVSSGLLPDNRRIIAQNVGMYLWDIHNSPTSRATFNNNSMEDNYVAWNRVNSNGTVSNNPWWFPSCGTNNITCSGNISGGRATLQSEAREYVLWLEKLNSNGVKIGQIK